MKKKTLLLVIIGICAILFLFTSILYHNQKIEIAIYPDVSADVLYFKIDFFNHLTIQHGAKSDNSLFDGDIMQNVKYEKKIKLEKSESKMIRDTCSAMETSPIENHFVYRGCSAMQVLYKNDFYVYYLTESACPDNVIALAQFLVSCQDKDAGTVRDH